MAAAFEQPPHIVVKRLDGEQSLLIIDTRSLDSFRLGHIKGAVQLESQHVAARIGEIAETDLPIVVYCERGPGSLKVVEELNRLGYSRVTSLFGGYTAWKEAGFPTEASSRLAPEQQMRYSRHLRLPFVGEDGQLKLLAARVLLIGVGGLGSPVGLYLSAAGVATIGVIDGDVVESSNLQRQVLHRTHDVGEPKVESASRELSSLNPDVTVIKYPYRIDAGNALSLIEQYDVVVDGSDNFETRYLVNDACYLANKSYVHGSIFQFMGMVTLFQPNNGPCYRCIHPEPPDPALVPS